MARSTKIKGHTETYITNLLAQDKPVREICNLVLETHHISIAPITVYKFAKIKEPVIERIRQVLSEKMLKRAVPIASEGVRLEREEALWQLSQCLKRNTERIDYGLRCLGAAREECKVNQPAATNIQFNQFNSLTDEQLLLKKRELEKSIIGLSKIGEGSYGKS